MGVMAWSNSTKTWFGEMLQQVNEWFWRLWMMVTCLPKLYCLYLLEKIEHSRPNRYMKDVVTMSWENLLEKIEQSSPRTIGTAVHFSTIFAPPLVVALFLLQQSYHFLEMTNLTATVAVLIASLLGSIACILSDSARMFFLSILPDLLLFFVKMRIFRLFLLYSILNVHLNLSALSHNIECEKRIGANLSVGSVRIMMETYEQQIIDGQNSSVSGNVQHTPILGTTEAVDTTTGVEKIEIFLMQHLLGLNVVEDFEFLWDLCKLVALSFLVYRKCRQNRSYGKMNNVNASTLGCKGVNLFTVHLAIQAVLYIADFYICYINSAVVLNLVEHPIAQNGTFTAITQHGRNFTQLGTMFPDSSGFNNSRSIGVEAGAEEVCYKEAYLIGYMGMFVVFLFSVVALLIVLLDRKIKGGDQFVFAHCEQLFMAIKRRVVFQTNPTNLGTNPLWENLVVKILT